mmetsp:Transcript_51219/g.165960  ORF Transcript_51219/g.165960 Transcript_51219/m.165960 type:complete len:225 (+) Transcript_51219:1023-1697(+)
MQPSCPSCAAKCRQVPASSSGPALACGMARALRSTAKQSSWPRRDARAAGGPSKSGPPGASGEARRARSTTRISSWPPSTAACNGVTPAPSQQSGTASPVSAAFTSKRSPFLTTVRSCCEAWLLRYCSCQSFAEAAAGEAAPAFEGKVGPAPRPARGSSSRRGSAQGDPQDDSGASTRPIRQRPSSDSALLQESCHLAHCPRIGASTEGPLGRQQPAGGYVEPL